jgi:hypothetical protein
MQTGELESSQSSSDRENNTLVAIDVQLKIKKSGLTF